MPCPNAWLGDKCIYKLGHPEGDDYCQTAGGRRFRVSIPLDERRANLAKALSEKR